MLENICKKYHKSYKELKAVYNYLSSYDLKFSEYRGFNSFKPEQIDQGYIDWVSILSKLDNSIDKHFFREFWIPVDFDSYDFFIDISTPYFSLFSINFEAFEPFWSKCFLTKNISEFLLQLQEDDETNYEMFDNYVRKELAQRRLFLKNLRELYAENNIFQFPINSEYFFRVKNYKSNTEREYENTCIVIDTEKIKIYNVNLMVLHVFPKDIKIVKLYYPTTIEYSISTLEQYFQFLATIGMQHIKTCLVATNFGVICFQNHAICLYTNNEYLKNQIMVEFNKQIFDIRAQFKQPYVKAIKKIRF